MAIAAALLAGGITFFAGFCLGLFPPIKPGLTKTAVFSAEQNKYFKNFLNYDGEIQS